MKRILTLLALSLVACNKPSEDLMRNGFRVQIIGHGGCGVSGINQPLPFNSLESILRAVTFYNADGIETDVQLSKDGVLFLFREAALEAESSCSGCIQQYTAAEVEQCRFRTFSASTTAYHIGRLATVLQQFSQRKIKPLLFLDLHPELSCISDPLEKEAYYERVAVALAALLSQYQAQEWVWIQSSYNPWLRKCRDKGLQVLKDVTDKAVPDALPETAAAARVSGIAANNRYISAGQVAEARGYGLVVQIHGERSKQGLADALGKAPDYLLTDNIPLLQQMLGGN